MSMAFLQHSRDQSHQQQQQYSPPGGMGGVMKTVHVEVDSVQAPPSPTIWLAADADPNAVVMERPEEFGRGKTRREVWEYPPLGKEGRPF